MKLSILFRNFAMFSLLILLYISCKKEDFGAELDLIRQEVSDLRKIILDLTQQLQIADAQTKNQIKITNSQIDSIDNKQLPLSISSLLRLNYSISELAVINKNSRNISATGILDTDSIINKLITQREDIKKSNNNKTLLAVEFNEALTLYSSALKGSKTITSVTTITGVISKGSFLRGSILNFYELDQTLTQTGRSFNASIKNDYGDYSLSAQNLDNQIVKIVGDGFYWNEVLNRNSKSRIVLTGLVRVTNAQVANINVLTHLERPRVEQLMTRALNPLTFENAKTQAITEVLAAFGYTNTNITRAESVGLSGSIDNAKLLLAISAMIQGFRTESEVTELLSDISEDLKEDGVLSNRQIGDDIETHLFYMDRSKILDNFQKRYPNVVGIDLSYVQLFQNNTSYAKDKELIEYPEMGSAFDYPNFLNSSFSQFDVITGLFSCYAKMREGMDLKIELRIDDGSTYGRPITSLEARGIAFAYNDANFGWKTTKSDACLTCKLPFVTATETKNELLANVVEQYTYLLLYYENRSSIDGFSPPTRIRTITTN